MELTFKIKCTEEFEKYLNEHSNLEKIYKDFALEVFSAAFDYGSLNGASEGIQDYVIKNINPKEKNISDLVQQLRMKH